MTTNTKNSVQNGYINVVDRKTHKGQLTLDDAERHTEGFSKPALFKGIVDIDKRFSSREFYERIDCNKTLQWRVKKSDAPVSMRSEEGESDYNYVTGRIGTGREFLDNIFADKLDVYSHLGTISSGYKDPYEWGKLAFKQVRDEIFGKGWFKIDTWKITGHMFFGRSNQQYGEPRAGAVGSDWHMFPTLNIFVMIVGTKRWMTRPPKIGDQFRDFDKMFATSSGREAPGGHFENDTVYVEAGDVLLNPPFEWHKVLNAEGLTLGAAFRVIDTDYLDLLESRTNLDTGKLDPTSDEEMAHFLTSISYASRHINRAQMILNDLEYAYLRKKGGSGSIHIGHL